MSVTGLRSFATPLDPTPFLAADRPVYDWHVKRGRALEEHCIRGPGLQTPRRIAGSLASVVLALALAGCTSEPPAPSSEAPQDVARAPVDDRAALEACLAGVGYTVHPAQRGSNNVYSWERTSRFTWDVPDRPENIAASQQCAARFAPVRERTAAELRVIYDRWILEAQCLVSLGFHPNEPPPFSTFYEDWKTGPWMPIDGVPFQQLNGAKDLCGLEMAD